jgi:Lipopolysaccharide export system permease LptF/LptG
MSPVTSWFRRFLSRHSSAATMEWLVEPILTDIRFEANDACLHGRRWASLWIHTAGVVALVKALVLHGWSHFWSIQEWSREDRHALARTLAYSAIVTAAGIPLLMLPFLLRFPANRTQELAPYLVPQALPIALPVGLFIGLIYGFRALVVSLRPRTAVVIAAVLCSIASFVALAWVVPASNHAFRRAALNDPAIPKGVPELTLGELQSRINRNQQFGRDVSLMAQTYHARWALAAAPIVLTAWAFLLVGRLPTRGRFLLGIVAVASCVAYYFTMSSGRAAVLYKTIPPIAGAWLPNIVVVVAIVLLPRRTTNAYASPRERRTTLLSF